TADEIRNVTGVQTCALPISAILETTVDRSPGDPSLMLGHTAAAALRGDPAADLCEGRRAGGGPQRPQLPGDLVEICGRIGPVDQIGRASCRERVAAGGGGAG